jgi:hypothetical protein
LYRNRLDAALVRLSEDLQITYSDTNMAADTDQSTRSLFKSFGTNSLPKRPVPPWPSWGYLILAWPFIGMALLISVSVLRSARIAPYQAITHGVITCYDPPNHNQSRYAFTVADHKYTGESNFPGAENPPIHSVVTVYYDARDANTNNLQPYASLSRDDASVAILLFTLGSAVIVIVIIAMARKHFLTRGQ